MDGGAADVFLGAPCQLKYRGRIIYVGLPVTTEAPKKQATPDFQIRNREPALD
jgi:hypothetical protein